MCNYKYRTFTVGNRCFFRDADVAKRYPYELPTSKVVVFAQSVFAARLFMMFFCGLGAWAVSSAFLFFVQVPSEFKRGDEVNKSTQRSGGNDAEKNALVGGSGGAPE